MCNVVVHCEYLERLEPELGEYLLRVEGRCRCDADGERPPARQLQRLSDELGAEARVALRRVRRQDEQLQVRVAVVPNFREAEAPLSRTNKIRDHLRIMAVRTIGEGGGVFVSC